MKKTPKEKDSEKIKSEFNKDKQDFLEELAELLEEFENTLYKYRECKFLREKEQNVRLLLNLFRNGIAFHHKIESTEKK